MKKIIIALSAAAAVGFLACSSSSDPFAIFAHNGMAVVCNDPQAAVNNLPIVVGNSGLAVNGLTDFCKAFFGQVPAPTPAPGNSPVASHQ